ncbi:hypothetical protein LJC12_01410 [Odoribacter sp. OttesenSCG-928-J03]|nr:hypothetical protein [Odoribacter sp. OttesenSCG-928-J03]MDL2330729.1 hypothetical protein [Odoribacter sp. OttesenSCG-928-A06]
MIRKCFLFFVFFILVIRIDSLAQITKCEGYADYDQDFYGTHNEPGDAEDYPVKLMKIQRNNLTYPGDQMNNIYYCIQAGVYTVPRKGDPYIDWCTMGTMECDENGLFVGKTPYGSTLSSTLFLAKDNQVYFQFYVEDMEYSKDMDGENTFLRVIFAELNSDGTGFEEGYVYDQMFCISDNWFSDGTWEPVVNLGPTLSSGPTLAVSNLGGICWPATFNLEDAIDNNGTTAGAEVKFYTDAAATIEVADKTAAGLSTNPSGTETVTFYAKAFKDGEESSIESFTVVYYSKPDVQLVFGDGYSNPVCAGAATTIKTTPTVTGATYRYYKEDGTFNQTPVPPSATYTFAQNQLLVSGQYKVEVTTALNAGQCKDTAELSVTVTDITKINTVNLKVDPVTICAGEEASLAVSLKSGDDSDVSYVWTAPTAVENSTDNPLKVSPTTTTTYSVKGKIGDCMTVTAQTVKVTVLPKPTLSVGSPAAYCGTAYDLVAWVEANATKTNVASYKYYSDAALSTEITTTANAVTSGTYHVVGVSADNCVSDAVQVTVNVNAPPVAVINVQDNKTSACSGTSLTLTGKPDGLTYAWSGHVATATGQNVSTKSLANGDNSITLTVTDANNCTDDTTIVITGISGPDFTITPVTDACKGAEIALETTVSWASGTNPAASNPFTWTCDNAAAVIADASAQKTTATLGGGANKFTATAIDDVGCSTSKDITVTGNVLTVSMSADPVMNVTPTTEVKLTATAKWNGGAKAPNGGYLFYKADAVEDGALTASGAICKVTSSETTEYALVATHDGCVSDTFKLTVTVTPDAFVVDEIAGTVFSVCTGETNFAAMSVSASGGTAPYTYEWTLPSGMTAAATDESELNISAIDYDVWVDGPKVITVKVTDDAGLNEEKTVYFTVNALPVIKINNVASGSTLNTCFGTAFQMEATIGGNNSLAFEWQAPIAEADKNKNPVSVSGLTVSGSPYTFEVQGTDNLGCQNTATVTVNVNPNPSVSLAAQVAGVDVDTLCPGTEVTLSATPTTGVTYKWQGGAAGKPALATATVTPASVTGTTYIVEATDGNLCKGTASVQLWQREKITLDLSTNPTAVCPGGVVTLSVTNADKSTLQWEGESLSSADDGKDTVYVTLNTFKTGGYEFKVSGKDVHGCDATQGKKTVNVINTPTLTLNTNELAGCIGTPVDLKDAIKAPYSGTPMVTDVDGNNATNVTTVSAAGEYKIYLDAGTCQTASQSVTVTFNALPTVELAVNGGATEGCHNTSVTFTASGATEYSWDNAAFAATATKTYTLSNTTATPLVKEYVVKGKANGCTNTDTVKITVNPLPQISIDGSTNVCANQPVVYSVNPTGVSGVTYAWNSGAGTEETFTFTPSMSNNTVSVVATNGITGCTNTASKTLTVQNAPTLNIIAIADLCEGSSRDLNDYIPNQTGFDNISFYATNASDATPLASAVVSPVTTTTYYAEGFIGGGCSTGKQPIQIQVKPAPSITITVLPAETICAGDKITLTASATGAASYKWIEGSGIASANAATTEATPTGSGTVTYKVEVLGQNSCKATQTKDVTVQVKPVIAWNTSLSSASPVLEGEDIVMVVEVQTGTLSEYRWIKPQEQTSVSNSYTVNNASTETQFAVVMEDVNGCISDTLKKTVEVTPAGGLLAVSVEAASNELCNNGIQILTAKATGGTPGSGYIYQWYNGATEMSGETNKQLIVSQNGNYKVVVKDNGTIQQTEESTVVDITKNAAKTSATIAAQDMTVKNGGSTVMFANVATSGSATSYTWVWSPEDKLASNKTTANPKTAALYATTDYQVYAVGNDNCISNIASPKVTVDNSGGFTVVPSADVTICQGSSTILRADIASSVIPAPSADDLEFKWTPAAGLSADNVQYPKFTASSSAGVKTFYVQVKDSDGRVAGASINVTISSSIAPQVILSSNSAVKCDGDKISATVTNGVSTTGFEWFIDGVRDNTNNTSQFTLAARASEYAVKVVAKTAACVSDTASRDYMIYTKPTIAWNPTPGATAEANTSVTLNVAGTDGTGGTTGSEYRWINPTTTTTTGELVHTLTQNTTFMVKYFDGRCESDHITHTITATAPTQPIVVTSNVNSGILCSGGSVVLTVTNVTGGSNTFPNYSDYSWYKDSDLSTAVGTGLTYAAMESGTYRVVVTDVNNKTGYKDITITSSPAQAPVAYDSEITIASGSKAVLSPTITGGSGSFAYLWAPADQLETMATDAAPRTVALSAETDYTYYVTDNTTTCTSNAGTVKVKVLNASDPALFTILATASPNAGLCIGNTSQLNVTATPTVSRPMGSLTYEWSPNDGRLSANNTANPVFTADVAGTFNYSVKVTEQGGITATAAVQIEVVNGNAPQLTLNSAGDCSGDKITVTVGSGTILYSWFVDGVAQSGVTGNELELTYSNFYANREVAVIATAIGTPSCKSDTIKGTYLRKEVPTITWKTTNPTRGTEGVQFAMVAEVTPASSVCHWEYTAPNGSTSTADFTDTWTVFGVNATEGNHKFSVYADLNGCSSAPIEKTIPVISASAGLTVGTSQDEYYACQNGSVEVSATAYNGGSDLTFRWYRGGNSTTGTLVAEGATVMLAPTASPQIFTVEVTDNATSDKAEKQITLRYNSNTALVVGNGATTILSGNSAILPSSILSGSNTPVTYHWTPASGLASGEAGKANPQTSVLTTAQSPVSYEYYIEDNKGCLSNKGEVIVTVTSTPTTPVITATSTKYDLCLLGTATFDVSSTPALSGSATYVWSPAKYLNNANIKSPTFTVDATAAAELAGNSIEYMVTVTEAGKTYTDKVVLNIGSGITPTINWSASNPDEVDAGNSIAMTVNPLTPAADYTYHWSVTPSATSTTSGNVYTIPGSSVTGGKYAYEVYARQTSTGCTSNILLDTVNVKADSEPITIVVSSDTICEKPGMGANIWIPLTVTSHTPSTTEVIYAWKRVGGNSLAIQNNKTDAASMSANIQGAGAGKYEFEVTVTDKNNASNYATATVHILILSNPVVTLAENCIVRRTGETFELKLVSGVEDLTNFNYLWKVSEYNSSTQTWGAETVKGTNPSSETGTMQNNDLRYTITATGKSSPYCTASSSATVYRIPDAPTIKIDTNLSRYDIKLTWNDVGADGYTVWSRKWDPYCLTDFYTGDFTYQKEITTAAGVTSWVEKSNLDSLKFFYVTSVRDVCGNSYESYSSADTVGYKNDRLLVHPTNTTKSYNVISLLFDSQMSTTEDLFRRITRHKAIGIRRWDDSQQVDGLEISVNTDWASGEFSEEDLIDWGIPEFDGDVAPLELGEIYLINTKEETTLVQYGVLPPRRKYQFTDSPDGQTKNLHVMALFLHRSNMTDVTDIFEEITGTRILGIAKWDFDQQVWGFETTLDTDWASGEFTEEELIEWGIPKYVGDDMSVHVGIPFRINFKRTANSYTWE